MVLQQKWILPLLISCVINLCLGVPTLQTSKGAVFEFEGTPDAGECQVCTKIYTSGQDLSTGFFRLEWNKFAELDSTGATCCAGGSNCPYNVGCNNHVMPSIANIFAVNSTSSIVNYDGFVRAGGAQTTACTPPGTSLICVPFEFDNVLNNQDSQITYQGLTIYGQSLRTTIKISSWPFAAGSTGLLMRVLVMARLTGVQKFYKEPGHVVSDEVSTNNFDGVAMVDDLSRQAAVYFSKTALVDGVTTNVNVTGLVATAYDSNGKYVDIVFPIFNSSIEYTLNLLVPSLSGIDVPTTRVNCDVGDTWCNNKTYFIIGISVGGGTLLCFGCFIMYCKAKRYRRAKKKDYY